ncbi:hypothetical protein KKF91_14495 [Myxococcota bacterium]|nr:hypothetical protein [Myxococcota bacterium]
MSKKKISLIAFVALMMFWLNPDKPNHIEKVRDKLIDDVSKTIAGKDPNMQSITAGALKLFGGDSAVDQILEIANYNDYVFFSTLGINDRINKKKITASVGVLGMVFVVD